MRRSANGGIRGVLGAGTLALLLALVPTAGGRAAEVGEAATSEAIALLLQRDLPTAEERLAEAERLLDRERTRRLAGLLDALGSTAWRGVSGASPRSLLKSVRRLADQARGVLGRSQAESSALALLEPVVASGESDQRILELYGRLREGERLAHFTRALEEAERALEVGELRRAGRRLARAAELGPDDPQLAALAARLAECRGEDPAEREDGESLRPPGSGETEVAAALLVEQYERAAALAETVPETELVRGAALLLAGQRQAGLEALRSVREGQGRVAELAARWLADPDLDPETAMLRERRRYRTRRVLGFIGGDALEAHGLDLSRQGVRSWGESLTPMNLALSVPVRMARGRPADGSALREAALRYLELEPAGKRAEEARGWLAKLQPSHAELGRHAVWDDGRLILPSADTPYLSVAARPLVISREALVRALPDFDVSREPLAGARAITLVPGRVEDPELALELAADEARALLSGLAAGLEAGRLRSLQGDTAAALADLGRVAESLRRGRPLFAEPRSLGDAPMTRALRRALLGDGAPQPAEGVRFRRRRNGLEARNELSRSLVCPPGVVCLDRARRVTTAAYARFDADGDLRLGATTRFIGASLALEITESGPRGALHLPIAAWLGVARWVPVSADLAFGLDGVSVRPTFGRSGI